MLGFKSLATASIILDGIEMVHMMRKRQARFAFNPNPSLAEQFDILASSSRLEALGFARLEISPNYYDDPEARFGLDPDLADRLKAANILYDPDASGGEYFQLYSPVIGEGFFFELVERRGGYAGYGAPNAPFRIAAQRRALPPKGMPRN